MTYVLSKMHLADTYIVHVNALTECLGYYTHLQEGFGQQALLAFWVLSQPPSILILRKNFQNLSFLKKRHIALCKKITLIQVFNI